MKNLKKRLFHLILLLILLGLDQISKNWAANVLKNGDDIIAIPHVIRFSYLENTGAIWGIFSGRTVFLLIFTMLVLGVIIFFYFRVPFEKRYLPVRLLLVSIAAGALGNIIDRFRYAYVIDFIKFEFIQFPTFNVADIYITVSTFLFMFLILFVYRDEME